MEQLGCASCGSLVLDPVAAPCGDILCLSCFEQWRSHPQPDATVACPTCSRSFSALDLAGTGVCIALQLVMERLFPAALAKRRQSVLARFADALPPTASYSTSSKAPSSRGSAKRASAPPSAAARRPAPALLEASDESSCDQPAHAPAASSLHNQRKRQASQDVDSAAIPPAKRMHACNTECSLPPAGACSSPQSAAPGQYPWWGMDSVAVGTPVHAFAAAWASAAAAGVAVANAFGASLSVATDDSSSAAPATGPDANPAAVAALSQPWHEPNDDGACRVDVARRLLRLVRARGLMRAVGDLRAVRAVQHAELMLYRRALSRAEFSDPRTLEGRMVLLLEARAQGRTNGAMERVAALGASAAALVC